MVQKVITTLVCDVCAPAGQEGREIAFSGLVTVGVVSRQVDLCGEHKEELIGRLAEQLAEIGTRTGLTVEPWSNSAKQRRRVKDEKARCFLCGEGPFKTLAMHLRSKHDMTLEEARARSEQGAEVQESLPEAPAYAVGFASSRY